MFEYFNIEKRSEQVKMDPKVLIPFGNQTMDNGPAKLELRSSRRANVLCSTVNKRMFHACHE